MQNEPSEIISLLLFKMKEDSLITGELYEKAMEYLAGYTYYCLEDL